MAVTTNPFTVLSYVSGPALLTNSTALLLLSTSNRFGRAIDRARDLVTYLEGPEGPRGKEAAAHELVLSQKRVRLIAQAMSRFYLATGVFAMATMTSIAGAVLNDYLWAITFNGIIAFAAASGIAGFVALVSGAISLVLESRLAVRSLKDEAREAVETINRVLRSEEP